MSKPAKPGSGTGAGSGSGNDDQISYDKQGLVLVLDGPSSPFACSNVTIGFRGGCEPYALSAFYYPGSNMSVVYCIPIQHNIYSNLYTWTSA